MSPGGHDEAHEETSTEIPGSRSTPKNINPEVKKAIGAIDVGIDVITLSGILLLVAASAAALVYSRRNRDVASDEPPDRAMQSVSGLSPGSSESDIVEVSTFAPAIGKAEEDVFIQVFFHTLDQTVAVEAQAAMIDPTASARGKATLDTEISRGERISVILEGPPDLKIDQASQYLIWRGEPRSCQFIVTLPPVRDGRRTIHLRVRLLLAGIPVGDIRFPMAVSAYEETEPLESAGHTAHRNRRAFLSYASPDRAEVLKRMQALKVARIECFQDFIDLEPGERWERRLYQEIDRCDLFVLFWSTAAANSQWVAREAEYALRRQKMQGEKVLDITPIILEGPPVPAAPDILKDIHFDDAVRYVIAAVEAEASAPGADGKPKYKRRAAIPLDRTSKGASAMPGWLTAVKSFAREWMI